MGLVQRLVEKQFKTLIKTLYGKKNKMKLKGGVFAVLQYKNFTLFRDIQTKINEYHSQRHKVWLFKFLMIKENSIK